MSAVERAHEWYARSRRVRVLSQALAPLLPERGSLLDVGCGDGAISAALRSLRPALSIEGVDVLAREDTAIPVRAFDGEHLPHADAAVDAVLFVDVLHHCEDPLRLLAEGARVARRSIVIKDHRLEGFMAHAVLRFMDRVGNERHGVALPYAYWTHEQWHQGFETLGLTVERWSQDVPLYPPPVSFVFGRGLHFVAKLGVP